MLNRTISILCVVCALNFIIPFKVNAVSSNAVPEISAESAVVIIANTGEVVYSKCPYKKMGIASTTKIMTSLLALERKKPYDKTVVYQREASVEGTSMGLKSGDCVNLKNLVLGMLLSSGNDAATVTARMLGGSVEGFSQMMNEKALKIGMNSTHFTNPSGLTDENHYSTAYDMALLGAYAIGNQDFRRICSLKKAEIQYGNPVSKRVIYNHNKFLRQYDGAIGIKTGFTKASGRCLVTAAERNGATLVAVTLNAPNDWSDHRKMLDYAFSKIKYIEVPFENKPTAHIVGDISKEAFVEVSEKVRLYYYKNKPQYKIIYYLPKFFYDGINKGDILGFVELIDSNNKIIFKSPMVAGDIAA